MTRQFIKSIPLIGSMASYLGNFWRFVRGVNKKFWFCRRNKKWLQVNSELKDRKLGQRCFILATGPSIKDQDLKRLEGQFVISLSNFFVHPDFKKIKPEYHIFVASHTPVSEDQYTTWFRDAEKHFPDGQKVLISLTDKYLVDRAGLFKKQKVYYYVVGDFPLDYHLGGVDFSRQLPTIQTSTHIAIYLALFLAYKEIYLLGCEHDWLLHFGESKHFYDEKNNVMTGIGYTGWHSFQVTLECYLRLWNIYQQIKDYALKRNILICNSTPKSLLDVFPRKPLEEVLG